MWDLIVSVPDHCLSFYFTESTKSTSYLDCLLEIDNSGKLSTKLYDKRDDFNFPIVNFPLLCGNIKWRICFSTNTMIWYARSCSLYHDFIWRARQLATRLLKPETRVHHQKVLWTTLSACRNLHRFSHTTYMWHFRNMLNGNLPAQLWLTPIDKSKWKHGDDTSMAQNAYHHLRTPGLILGFQGFRRPRISGIHVSFWILEHPM